MSRFATDAPSAEIAAVRHEQAFHLRELCGREDFLAEIDGWIEARPDGGVLLLTGGPGAGKSVVAAEIARRHDAALHMMKAHRGPATLIASLVQQLLERAGIAAPVPTVADIDDLRTVLVDALEALASVDGRAVVVIDGLDELVDEVALDVVPRHPPPGVRVILTSRPDQAVLRRLRSAIGELEEKSVPALSRTDVRAIVERRAGRAVDASIIDRIAETTAGLPLLVRHAGSMLARATAPGEGDELSELPATLSAFGAESYRAIRGPGDDADVRGRLFQLLGLAREPIGAAALHDLLQLDGEAVTLEQCREHLESMSSFLVEARVGPHGATFRPFHEALTDFVRAEVLGEEGVRRTERLFTEWNSGELAAEYALRHRIRHLIAAGDRGGARALVEAPITLVMKLRKGLVFELVRELDLVGSGLAPQVRRHAHFLARHPYALSTVVGVADRGIRLHPLRPVAAAASTAGEVFVLRGHEGEVFALALCPETRLLASVSRDATLRLWDLESAGLQRTIALPGRRALAVAISAEGHRIACGTDGAGVVIVARDGEILRRDDTSSVVWSVDFASDDRLAIGLRSGEVEIQDRDGERIARFGVDGIVTAVAFSRDGARLAAATTRGKIVVVDDRGGTLWRAGPLADTPWALAWTPEGTLYAACADGAVRAWDAAGMPGRERTVPDDRLYAASLSRDGALLAFGGKRGLVHTVNVSPSADGDDEIASASVDEEPIDAIVMDPSSELVVAASSGGVIRGFRASAVRRARPEGERPHAIAITPRGDVVAIGGYDGTVSLVRLPSPLAPPASAAARAFAAHAARIGRIAFSGDGALVATASQDATAKVFRLAPLLASGGSAPSKIAPLAELHGHDGAVTSIAVVGTGGRVVTGSRDMTARVWSVFGARQLHVMAHDETVIAVAADESGARAATLTRDGALLVFAVDDGSVIARGKTELDTGAAHALSFATPDELRLHDRTGGATVWRIDGGALRPLDARSARAFLPRFILRSDPRAQESVLVDSQTGRPVAAFPGFLALAAATPEGERFAGWWAGELQVLDVESPAAGDDAPGTDVEQT